MGRAADLESLRSVNLCAVYSWIMNVIVCPSDSVSDQVGRLKRSLMGDNLAYRAGEFFRKSGKKAMIVEGVRNGFVRRDLSTKVRAA